MNQKNQSFRQILSILKKENYALLQYVPTRKNLLAIIKEPENFINLFRRKKHLLFYYSVFPLFYKWFLTFRRPYLFILWEFCFENKAKSKDLLVKIFPAALINQSLDAKIFSLHENLIQCNYSIIPYQENLIISGPRHAYDSHQLYDQELVKDRVWIGPDSIKFAKLNQKYLENHQFKNVLEIGSGSGIQLIAIADRCKKLTAIDINPKAVEQTELNGYLNEVKNLRAIHSDLFKELDETYDLIISNPWFIDIEQGGLEEIPAIFQNLNDFLDPNGIFTIILTSYVQNGRDLGREFISNYVVENQANASFHTLGKSINLSYYNKFLENKISHTVDYYVKIKLNGTGKIEVISSSILRRLRDFGFIKLYKIIYYLTKK